MADNASNNNELYNYLFQNLLVAKKEQLWCVGYIINLIIKALIYGKGVSKLERLMISISKHIKFNLMRQKGSMGKIYNIIKYIMRLIKRREDFTKNQAKAYIKDKLFN